MSDLSSLMEIAPITAAGMMGEKNALSRQEQQLKQQELMQTIMQLQQKMKQSADLHPYAVDAARLGNQGLEADLPGKRAKSDLEVLKSRGAAATFDSDVEATNVKNRTETQAKLGQALVELGPWLEGTPTVGGQRTAKAMQALTSLGISPQDPKHAALVQRIMDTPPEQLPKFLEGVGRKLAMQKPEYIRVMDQERLQQEGANSRQASQNSTQLETARINAQSRENAAKARAGQSSAISALLKSKNYQGAAAVALAMAMEEQDPTRKAQLEEFANRMATQAMNEKQAGATAPGKPDMASTTGLPQVQQPEPFGGGVGKPPAPAAQPQIKTLGDLSKLYPGVPPAKLRELYKKKFGVDLQ
jgi:hypothetical protein